MTLENVAEIKVKLENKPTDMKVNIKESGPQGVPGVDGYTPIKGVDYWTKEDVDEMKSYIDEINSDKNVSWDTLNNKPFGEVLTKVIIIPEALYASRTYYTPSSYEPLIEDQEYIVKYKGVEYKCIAEYKVISLSKTGIGVGNDYLNDESYGLDNELPFCIVSDKDENGFYITFAEGVSRDTIRMYSESSTIKQIDPDYIPSEYLTEDDLNTKGYATETFVNNAINDAIGSVLEGEF